VLDRRSCANGDEYQQGLLLNVRLAIAPLDRVELSTPATCCCWKGDEWRCSVTFLVQALVKCVMSFLCAACATRYFFVGKELEYIPSTASLDSE